MRFLAPQSQDRTPVACYSSELSSRYKLPRERFSPSRWCGPLIRLGFLAVAFGFLSGIVVGVALLVWTGGHPRPASDGGAAGSVQSVAMLLAMLPVVIVMLMALLFAPALVVFEDVRPLEALKSSLIACLRNIRAVLLYGVLGLALMILGLIPFGLGLAVVGPVVTASVYAAYRDIFFLPEPS